MDKDGYPEDEELKQIREWPHTGFSDLMEFIEPLFYQYGYFSHRSGVYVISTGGWSGNEDVIDALHKNTMFWSMCWRQSKRGGHYEFEIPTETLKLMVK